MKGHRLEMRARAINSPRHPLDLGGGHIFLSFFLHLAFLHIFLSSKHQKKHVENTQKTLPKKKKKKKTHQSFFILASSPTTQGSVLVPNLHLLGSTSWLGFRGVDVALLAIIHTPNLLNLFPSMFLLFLP